MRVPEDHMEIGRLAMRAVGDEWHAYYMLPDSARDPILLGMIKLKVVERQDRHAAFMALMQEVVADIIEEQVGERPTWGEPREAPFWEKGR
jgi:hypothetical protein